MTKPPEPTTPLRTLPGLLAIIAALRDPGTGCPWDKAQTFASIAPYTIEEAYEAADAIQRGHMGDLRDELGDLLFQVVYHSRMAEEQGHFAFADVVDAISSKMLRRHPHVFGTDAERGRAPEPGFWERLKADEKKVREVPGPEALDPNFERELSHGVEGGPAAAGKQQAPHAFPSLLDGVPVALPALTRAVKLQDKAARVGFDWPSLKPVFAKLREELGELEEALAGEARSVNSNAVAEELGDLLFVVANVARHLKIDPEAALRGANGKFTRRFRHIEARLRDQGRSPLQSSLAEMDRLWDEAKTRERAGSPLPARSRGEG